MGGKSDLVLSWVRFARLRFEENQNLWTLQYYRTMPEREGRLSANDKRKLQHRRDSCRRSLEVMKNAVELQADPADRPIWLAIQRAIETYPPDSWSEHMRRVTEEEVDRLYDAYEERLRRAAERERAAELARSQLAEVDAGEVGADGGERLADA